MSSTLSWELPEVHSDPPPEAIAYCEAAAGSIAIAIPTRDSLRCLVAADVGRYSLMISHTFRRAVNERVPLTVIAEMLDAAVSGVSMPSVCATIVDVNTEGFTVLHRGGPSPLIVRADGTLTRVVPTLPGPPLGPHESRSVTGSGEFEPAASGDVMLLTTPGSVESTIRAMALAATPALADLRVALRSLGPAEAGNAYALVEMA
ncbi:MAG TPA: SpoIIE family protein phosphatase [Actinomycetes bacterium]|nr:SpoIIE family protein phosphatase [Actinomycetes bacterium]